MKGHRNFLKPDSPKKISEGLVHYWNNNPKEKLDHNGNSLPKYVHTVCNDKQEIIGYCVFIHANKKRKKITSKKKTNDEKLSEALYFLKTNL